MESDPGVFTELIKGFGRWLQQAVRYLNVCAAAVVSCAVRARWLEVAPFCGGAVFIKVAGTGWNVTQE